MRAMTQSEERLPAYAQPEDENEAAASFVRILSKLDAETLGALGYAIDEQFQARARAQLPSKQEVEGSNPFSRSTARPSCARKRLCLACTHAVSLANHRGHGCRAANGLRPA